MGGTSRGGWGGCGEKHRTRAKPFSTDITDWVSLESVVIRVIRGKNDLAIGDGRTLISERSIVEGRDVSRTCRCTITAAGKSWQRDWRT